MSETTLDSSQSALLARKGEAMPADARPAPGTPAFGTRSPGEGEEASEIDGFDLNSLIRRRAPIGAGSLPPIQVESISGAGTERSRPDRLPLALMAKGAAGAAANETVGNTRIRHADAGRSNGTACGSCKRRQLTLRLWPEEFDRLRAVATIAHTSYQEILAGAAVIFLDHVLPSGAPADEESIADGWHRLKNGEL